MTTSRVPRDDPGSAPFVLRLFGPFEARCDGAPLPPTRTRKSQWLLALLALRDGAEVDRAWLAGTLWPESPPHQTLATLRRTLTDLRHALGDQAWRLRSPTARRTLSLDLADAVVDVLRFDACIARGGDPQAGTPASLVEAVGYYRGPLLEGCPETWALQERLLREQAYLAALERLADHAVSVGNPAAAEERLRRAVATDPLRESAQRRLMQLLASGGNYAAALLAYRELRLLLHRELRAAPDGETTALFHRIQADAGARRESATGRHAPSFGLATGSSLAAPEGTITFLFTDIEGSTRLWEAHPEAMREALARHDALMRHAIETNGGKVFKTVGDQFCAAFAIAPDALHAALASQRTLSASSADQRPEIRVRMALHTGTVEARDGDYFGPPLNRLARLLDAGHGGQLLLSAAAQELVRDLLPEHASLRDLGEHRLRDLSRPERIFQLLAPDLPSDFPPLDALDARPNNLPAQPTPLLGREREVVAVCELLRQETVRLVTLTGTGGTGKTRLGLQVAADLLDDFRDGAFFVALAPLRDSELVASTIARALGVPVAADRPVLESVKEHLKEKRLLLLLDNFEHLPSAAALVADLLTECPRLKVLVTSREPLRLRGEKEFSVPPLATPDPERLPAAEALSQYAAVALFIQRSLDVNPEFVVTNENAPAVAGICHRLDGLPLAIELAAARSKLLSPEALLVRLERRLPLLVGGARDMPARHQTLRAAIGWSYDLLTEEEQRLFRRLAVFVGGFTLGAAEAVAEGGLDLVASLVDKSLLRPEEDGEGERRLGMLETIREFAQECLAASGESEAMRRRHADYYVAFAEKVETQLLSPETARAMDRLESEHDNLRAVLTWSIEAANALPSARTGEIGLRLGGAVQHFWDRRGYATEGKTWLSRLLALDASQAHIERTRTVARAKALHGAAQLARYQRDTSEAKSFYEESLSITRASGDRTLMGRSLIGLGLAAAYAGEFEAARSHYEEALAICRELGDRRRIGQIVHNLGFLAREQGDLQRAEALLEESRVIHHEMGDDFNLCHPLEVLGTVRIMRGEYAGALALLEEALTITRRIRYSRLEGDTLRSIGMLYRYQGDLEAASSRYAESIRLHQSSGDRGELMQCLVGLGCVAMARGERAIAGRDRTMCDRGTASLLRGARLFGAAAVLREISGRVIRSYDRAEHDRCVAVAREALGEAVFAAAWAEGKAMSIEQVCELALGEGEG